MLNDSYSFVVGTESGNLDLYSPFEFEDKSTILSYKDPKLKSCYIMHRNSHAKEGSIVAVKNWIFEAEREHCVIYATQKGFIHSYDLRCRNSLLNYNIGIENGCISALELGPRPNQVMVGTLSGKVIIHDFRYNLPISQWNYTKDASILGIQHLLPKKLRKFSFYNANNNSPLAFISTSDGQISLIDLTERSDELKETELIIFSGIKEEKNPGLGIFKEPKQSKMLGHSVSLSSSVCSFSKRLPTLASIQRSIKLSPTSMTSILCPKHPKSKFSASYIIGGDHSGKLKYWDIERDSTKRKWFYKENNETIEFKRKKHNNTFNVISDE